MPAQKVKNARKVAIFYVPENTKVNDGYTLRDEFRKLMEEKGYKLEDNFFKVEYNASTQEIIIQDTRRKKNYFIGKSSNGKVRVYVLKKISPEELDAIPRTKGERSWLKEYTNRLRAKQVRREHWPALRYAELKKYRSAVAKDIEKNLSGIGNEMLREKFDESISKSVIEASKKSTIYPIGR